MSIPLSSGPLLVLVLLILAILTGIRWNPEIVLTFVFLFPWDAEQFQMYSLAIFMFSFWNFRSIAISYLGWFFCFCLILFLGGGGKEGLGTLCFLSLNSLSDAQLARIFFYSRAPSLPDYFFAVQKPLSTLVSKQVQSCLESPSLHLYLRGHCLGFF